MVLARAVKLMFVAPFVLVNGTIAFTREVEPEGALAVITFDMINALNHVEFVDPMLSLQSRASFGVINTQYGTPRAIQLGLRLEF